MKNTLREGRSGSGRLTSTLLVVLSTTAPLLGACAADSSDAVAPVAPPSAGTVDVEQPIRLADHARVPEKEPGFIAAQVSPGKIVITHGAAMAPLNAGEVIGGTQGGGYVARIKRARALDAAHTELETEPAPLTDFISEGHFHVHYDAEAYAHELDRYAATLRELGEENGAPIASDAEALRISPAAPIRLLNLAGSKLPGKCGVGFDGDAHLDATAELSPAFDLEVEVGPKGGLNPAPELKKLRFVATGRLDVNASLSGSGTIKGHCTIDLLELAGAAISIPLPTLTFWIGPVPVVVTTEVAPKAKADIAMTFTAADVDAEAQTTTQIEAGVDYEKGAWSTVWKPSCTATGSASVGAPGPITAVGKVSAGAELRARLYGVAGPNIGLLAYARARAETAPPYCTYDARIDGGIEAYAQAEAGVSVGPLNLTIARLDLVDLDLVHVDGPHTEGTLRDAPECGD